MAFKTDKRSDGEKKTQNLKLYSKLQNENEWKVKTRIYTNELRNNRQSLQKKLTE